MYIYLHVSANLLIMVMSTKWTLVSSYCNVFLVYISLNPTHDVLFVVALISVGYFMNVNK